MLSFLLSLLVEASICVINYCDDSCSGTGVDAYWCYKHCVDYYTEHILK